MKRMAAPKEIANIVAFPASDQASHITGTNISVDGGIADYLLIVLFSLMDQYFVTGWQTNLQ